MAHLGALQANAWQMGHPLKPQAKRSTAISRTSEGRGCAPRVLRHPSSEQSCTDIMTRFGRAFGPRPLAFDAEIARRSHELSLYMYSGSRTQKRILEELGGDLLVWSNIRAPGKEIEGSDAVVVCAILCQSCRVFPDRSERVRKHVPTFSIELLAFGNEGV